MAKVTQTKLADVVYGAYRPRQDGGEGSIPIHPHLIRATGIARGIADHITETYHSYIQSTDRGGRAVEYLISECTHDASFHEAGQCGPWVGSISYAFPALRLPWPVIQDFSAYKIYRSNPASILKAKRIASCYRYTLLRGMPKNFASKALSISLRLLRKDWKAKFGFDLLGVITFVKPPWKGTCFRAANFDYIGHTLGRQATPGLRQHPENTFSDALLILAYHFQGEVSTGSGYKRVIPHGTLPLEPNGTVERGVLESQTTLPTLREADSVSGD